jgi:hypothetical protein
MRVPSDPAFDRRWWLAIRRAFGVPDVVGDDVARVAIARKLGQSTIDRIRDTDRNARVYADVEAAATGVVDAFRSAAEAGELDLPASGLGRVKISNGWAQVHDPIADAVAAIRDRASGANVEDWALMDDRYPEVMWERVSGYLAEHPSDDHFGWTAPGPIGDIS